MKIQVLKDGPVVEVDVANSFCPTGKGGGVDPSCGGGKGGGGGDSAVQANSLTKKADKASEKIDKNRNTMTQTKLGRSHIVAAKLHKKAELAHKQVLAKLPKGDKRTRHHQGHAQNHNDMDAYHRSQAFLQAGIES